jgi:glucosyl-3-phosphoglycerate synthase
MRDDARRWFAANTSTAAAWPIELVRTLKADTTVSVVLPALDEEATVGPIVRGVLALGDLVDEVVVMDSGSVDRTARNAREAGARVVHRDDVLPELGSRPGKGEVMWKALAATSGDLVVYLDADLIEFGPHFVPALIGPLLADAQIKLVKAFYDRPLLDLSATGGGRVTELTARPLLNLHFPELAGVVQPLAGECAARRTLLEALPFAADYGVEIAMLIDTLRHAGLPALAQVDLGERRHGHQSTAALGRMAAVILQAVTARLGHDTNPELTQFERVDGRVQPIVTPILTDDRPPMRTVPGYFTPSEAKR